jgi:hypothetical protein
MKIINGHCNEMFINVYLCITKSMFCYAISYSPMGCECWGHLKSIGNNDPVSYSCTIETLALDQSKMKLS